ncbi:MAG: PAS domain-containing protein, partial [Elusimicrobiota bacterium]
MKPIYTRSVIRFFISLLLCVFISETIVMLIVGVLPKLSRWGTALFDAFLLLIFLLPIFYVLTNRLFAAVVAGYKLAIGELVKLRKATDSSGEIIFLTDKAGVFTFINPMFTATYGYTAAEIIGKVTPRVFKSGMSTVEYYKGFWKRLLDGEGVRIEYTNKKKDGTLIDVESFASAIFDEDGEVVGFLGLQRDITERKRLQEVLLHSEEKYRSLFEANADGIVILVKKTLAILHSNPAIHRMFGYTKEEFDRLNVAKLHPKEDLSDITAKIESAFIGRVDSVFNIPCLHKRGAVFYADIIGGRITVDGQECVMGIFRDATARRLAEESLRRSEERYRKLFESSRDAIMTLAPPAWNFTSGNEATVKMFGVQDEATFAALGPGV